MIKIDNEEKILNMRKILITSIIAIIVIGIIILISLYVSESSVREWVDLNILKKSLTEDDTSTITLNTGKANHVYVYSKYIAVLNDKKIMLYNGFGEEQETIDINISSALFDSGGKYLVVGEENGNEVYLIQDKTYLWSNKVEGSILQVCVNRNGYVAVVTTDTTYRAILTVYDSFGKQLFRHFFASTRIVDVSISNDNKYIAIGELDSSGALIESNIKVISIENARNEKEDAIIYTYTADTGNLIINVEYQEKNNIVCMYDNEIDVISNEKNEKIFDAGKNNTTFMSINLSNSIVCVEEENTGLFSSKSNINIVNTSTGQENLHSLEEVAKEIYVNDDIIVANLGTELYFMDTKGWLIKKYTARQEISNVMLSSSLAAIIYKDKVVIINL